MSRSDQAVSRWKERLTPITVNGLRTYVLDEGDGDPVVFLHGIPTSSFLWRDVVPIVALENRCIALDLLGFGFADRPDTADLSPAGQAAFLTGVLDALGAERVALVGHDYGALVACEFLARAPERVSAITVTNTSVWLDDWKTSSMSPLRLINAPVIGKLATIAARPFMLKQAMRFYVDEADRLTDEAMAIYWHPFTDGYWDVLRRLNEVDGMTSTDFHRWREALYNFQGPGLVAWGANDPTFPPNRGAEIGKLLHDSRTDIFDHANHFIQEDRPDALGRLIVAFLNGSLLR